MRSASSRREPTGQIAAGLLATLLAISVGETIAWSLFAVSWSAAEEVQSILLVWFAWATAVHVAFRRAHIAIGFGSGPRESPWDWVGSLVTATFGVVATVYGALLAADVTNTLPATGISAAAHYLPAIVAGPLLVAAAFVSHPRPEQSQ